MRTGLLAGLLAIAVTAGGIVAADAATSIDINIGKTKGISCNTGKRIVAGKGYDNVRARDCNGEIFVYSGLRYGKSWWIEVRRRDGKILDTARRQAGRGVRGAMKVNRIVANIATADIAAGKRFYEEVLGLDMLMDMGWIATYGNDARMKVQLSIMSQGGSSTPVPDLSIEVDDVDEALARMRAAGFAIEYGPADEPWGVRRFYVRDPFGKLVNVLSHR